MKRLFISTKQGLLFWKMAIALAFLYVMSSTVGQYLVLTETYTGEAWANLSSFEKHRIYLGSLQSGLLCLIAFFNQSISNIKSENKNKSLNENTETIIPPAPPGNQPPQP